MEDREVELEDRGSHDLVAQELLVKVMTAVLT
jgi:hypothetical protein